MSKTLTKAPAGQTGNVICLDGTVATIDANGCVSVDPANVCGLIAAGFLPTTAVVALADNLYTDMADTAAAIITVASLLAKDATIDMAGTLTAGATLTLPTVASLLAAISSPYDGMTLKLRVINSGAGAFAWTLTTATGWGTLSAGGTMTVAQNTFRDFYIKITSVASATATLQSRGTGTNS